MKLSSQPRIPSKLSDSFQHQLNMYALAASAAGVGVLALAQPADAYTPAHVLISSFQYLDLNHHGNDFFLSINSTYGDTSFNSWISVGGVMGSNRILGRGRSAYALQAGAQIGKPGQFNETMLMAEQACHSVSCSYYGFWANGGKGVTRRYLGLKFFINGKAHYGWARLNVSLKPVISALLTGYAYETIPNKAIIAGKTKGSDVITVQPGSLGRLARGSAGLAAWRQKESTNGVR